MNFLKADTGKSQVLLTSKEEASIIIEDTTITSSSYKKLLGVLIDNKLTFNDHASKLGKKASQKIYALTRASNYTSKEKLRILMNSFSTSKFGYCSLVWMLQNQTLNNRIN